MVGLHKALRAGVVLGGIGGLAFELLQTRKDGQTGQVERPARAGTNTDWGVWASVIIGAVAAAAALWIFPPDQTTHVTVGGATVVTSRFDVVKVAGLSLIIGSAGSSFLAAMQARALALVKGQQAATSLNVAASQLTELQSKIDEGASQETLSAAVTTAKTALRAVRDSGPGNPGVADF